MNKFTFVIIKYAQLVLLLFSASIVQSQTVLGFYDFETGQQGWTSNAGSTDAFLTNTSWSYSGNNSYNLRGDSGDKSSMLSPAFSLSSYDKVDLKFFFSAHIIEPNEHFFVEYRHHSSATWQTVARYVSGNVTSKNADFEFSTSKIFYSKTATIFKTNFIFPSSASAQFRIRCNASDNNDNIFIDNITITGTTYKLPTNGPGGITTHLDLWLKADKLNGTTFGTNNASVSKWVDNAKGHDAEVVAPGQEPTYRNNADRNFNFNPTIDFENNNNTSGSDMTYLRARDEMKGTGGFNSNDIFLVLMPDPTITTNMVPLYTFTSTDPTGDTFSEDVTGFGYGGYSARFQNERLSYCIGTTTGPNNGFGHASISSSTDFNQISIVNFRHIASNDGMELLFNANSIGTDTSDPFDFISVNGARYFLGRSQYWDGSFDGRIAEVITYNSRKTDGDLTQEHNRIQSYLALKYGITLGANGTSQDYVDSAGTVIWDRSANAGYNFDIAGIGRDDASELIQKQSKSVNNKTDAKGPTQGILTIGLSDIYDTNSENINNNTTTFNRDKQYLVWGNNGADLNASASTISVNMSAGISPPLTTEVSFTAMQRIWKVIENRNGGDIPSVKISIPQNAIRNINPPGSYYMFISNTGVFDPTVDYRLMTSDGNGNLVTEYDFDTTKYITFGYAPQVIVERSIYFDGLVDYIDMDDKINLNPTGFTISAWIKRDTGNLNASIISKRNASFSRGYDFKINNVGKVQMFWKNGTNQSLVSNTTIPENEWHHVATIYNGTTLSLYIDGVLDKSANLTAPVNTSESFYIAAAGKLTPTQFFKGNIDEVRIWNSALSPEQLRFIMNQEIQENGSFVNGKVLPNTITKNEVATIPWNELEAYFPMSMYTYTNTDDASGKGNQGALRNLNTVDRQTAPLPYESAQNGNWNTNATWKNGTSQYVPGSTSIVNSELTVDWNIVRTTHNVDVDNLSLPTANALNRKVLTLMVGSNKLTVNGDIASKTGYGLTVTHYLKLNGTLDLEGESQLIQTVDSDFEVTSSGKLDREQQGTADKFTYNYWSSPVGVRNTTSNNNKYRVTNVIKDGGNSINWLNSGYNGTNTNPIGIADYWIWKFGNLPNDSYSSWQHVRSTGTILAGEGFTMKGPGTGTILTDQNYLFTGKPNNGNINLTLNAGNDYLVGNPYPSAIDGQKFILDNGPVIAGNGSTTGTLYFWEHWGGGTHTLGDYQGGYALFNLSGGTPRASLGSKDPDVGTGGIPTKIRGRYIPVSQGFFVVAEDAGGTIKFNNGQRVFMKEGSANSVFARNSEENSITTTNYNPDGEDTRMKFRIGFNSVNTIHRQLLLTLDINATAGIDWGYDGKLHEYQMDDMFWMIDDEKFTIQGTNTITTDTAFPIGIILKSAGENSIAIDFLENVPAEIDIYVHDLVLNTYHNIRHSPYAFHLPAGTYLERYQIRFQDGAALGLTENESNQPQVYYSNELESIVLLNPMGQKIKSFELFNIVGQSVYTNRNVETASYSEYRVRNLSAGSYIVKMITENGTISKKVLVK